MVTISCSAKLHAFALAEQMERHHVLDVFYTSYASPKNTIAQRLVKRTDRENIPAHKIHTQLPLALLTKIFPSQAHIWNDLFDKRVASKLTKSNSKVFIGWSGMSLYSIRAAQKKRMTTIVERGSSHIVFQDRILREEYKKFGIDFSVDPAVIKKELQEYQEADFISVPSYFVRDSFIGQGVDRKKILLNPYGASSFFTPGVLNSPENEKKFRIVYVGTLSVRKGLLYLFEALSLLTIPEQSFEVWFIGSIEEALKPSIEKYKKNNWRFVGKVDHYALRDYLVQCDLAVQPSLEEGLSMVILQLMSCGVPVIVTPNTGGANIIEDNVNGCIVPVRSPEAIAAKIQKLWAGGTHLLAMKKAAVKVIQNGFTWNDYGNRYMEIISKLQK
jgi:glycosyltransferase involved in cell wall biosynthesis